MSVCEERSEFLFIFKDDTKVSNHRREGKIGKGRGYGSGIYLYPMCWSLSLER